MTYTPATKKIVMSLALTPELAWRDNAAQCGAHGILETALLLGRATLDERRELYNTLKGTSLVSIPFVQLALDTEEWELQYLMENYGTGVFGLPAKTLSFSLLSRLPRYLPYFVFENPEEPVNQDLFTDETLARSGVKGVCLDLATLEKDRNHNEKKYNKTIHTLDHHPLLVSKVGPVPSAWYKKIIKSDSRRLTSLSDLHYLKHLPSSYLGSLIVLGVDNFIDEQLEIKEYLNLLLT